MKKIIQIFLFAGLLLPGLAQNNHDFESWTNGKPSGWYVNNVLNIFVPIVQSTDAHGGTYAVKGSVIPAAPNGYAPVMSAGENLMGFPINTRISALKGWYKFNSDSGDAFFVTVVLRKEGRFIGTGGFLSSDNVAEYKQFTAPLTTNSIEVPDTIQITIGISGATVHEGSVFYLDDLFYETLTGVDENLLSYNYRLGQNYPNPFNPATKINFSIQHRGAAKIILYDMLGREVETLLEKELDAGDHQIDFNAAGLTSGVYVYILKVNGYFFSRKMTIMK